MDELDRRVFEDVKSELIMCKHEKQRLSEKLDCLIVLLRRAWKGDNSSIEKLSHIVGISAPKIIPSADNNNLNDQLSREYLQITSSLLDEQLKEDATIRKTTKTLRPSSAKYVRPASATNRPKSSNKSRQKASNYYVYENGKDTKPPKYKTLSSDSQIPVGELTTDKFAMSKLADLLPMFSAPDNQDEVTRKDENYNGLIDGRRAINRNTPTDLFDSEPIIGARKPRPLSAALQQRQDYLRSQTKKRKSRPQTAKPAFNFAEIDYEGGTRSNNPRSPPDGAPESRDDFLVVSPRGSDPERIEHSISVDISKKSGSPKKVVTWKRNFFPPEKDHEALGGVTDALQRVQEMQRQFRISTRRLQEKIGIPDQGFV